MSEFKPVTEEEEDNFRETLKRCPEGTLGALLRYRKEGNLEDLNEFLLGCIKRHTDSEYHPLLNAGKPDISFIDDLGIDSMTMMEIVMMVEECLGIQIENQDLMNVRTLGDLNGFLLKSVEA
jgi:3-hydroxyacyl-[acyl-carrier-protein] dehydratase